MTDDLPPSVEGGGFIKGEPGGREREKKRTSLSEPRVILGLAKGVFKVIDADELARGAVDFDLDDVKTRLEGTMLFAQIKSGGAHDAELLALVDGVLSAEIRIGGARLDLDKDDLSPAARGSDDINLAQFVFIILFENFIVLFL